VAELQGLTESGLFRQVLRVALGASAPVDELPPPQPDAPGRQQRVHVRLTVDDRRLLKERATARGIASATYISLLVRSHLSGHAPLPKAEYLLLRQTVLELGAIGRNLNQIARTINLRGSGALPGRTEVMAMLKVAEGLRDHIKELLKTNQSSWNCRGTPPAP
jgi:hypothetical protein